jgi:hypothetical protein
MEMMANNNNTKMEKPKYNFHITVFVIICHHYFFILLCSKLDAYATTQTHGHTPYRC